MKRLALLALAAVVACAGDGWRPAEGRLTTRWTADVTPSNAHPEYPRPMMRRDRWVSLNGLWDYAITERDAEPETYQGRILVPYPIESALSGVSDTVGASRRLWYRRMFDLPVDWRGGRVLLHFEAVDWESVIRLNGTEVGRHRGGYDPFTIDITDALSESGANELVVTVWDPTDAGTQPRGKQVREPGGIFYTSVTGIWQTVWLEPVAPAFITEYGVETDIDGGAVSVTVVAPDAQSGDRVELEVLADGRAIGTGIGTPGGPITVGVPDARLWSPDDPFLYDLELRLVRNTQALDAVHGYFGMRKIAVAPDVDGVTRLLLNDRFVFQTGTLDQGYWPDGLYTAPTEEAMVYDLRMLKEMGFNMLRKHVKVEPRTYYAWCDRLGLLVWQDMPNADIPLTERSSDVPTDPEATEQFESELARVIGTLWNHPSIVMWVPFNEGWGQYDSRRIVDLVRGLDRTRPVNHASGWYERGAGDVVDRHAYPAPQPPRPEDTRAAVQGEFGGLGFNIPGHMWGEEGWGYALFPDQEALTAEFERLYHMIRNAADSGGLSAAVYTQTTDIESENNGLLTYDREIAKIQPEHVRLAQEGRFPPTVAGEARIFVDRIAVTLTPPDPSVRVRYTTDGRDPSPGSPSYEGPIDLPATATIKAQSHWPDGTSSRAASWTFTKVEPRPGIAGVDWEPGLEVDVYEQPGDWRALPDFDALTPIETIVADRIGLDMTDQRENFGLRFRGVVVVPTTGVYGFHLSSDDGSRLTVGGEILVDNDGVHGDRLRSGYVALTHGAHEIELVFFQGRGGVALSLRLDGPGFEEQEIPAAMLRH